MTEGTWKARGDGAEIPVVDRREVAFSWCASHPVGSSGRAFADLAFRGIVSLAGLGVSAVGGELSEQGREMVEALGDHDRKRKVAVA